MQLEIRKIDTLYNWSKNPRTVKEDDFKRLLNQIKKLGQYKPLIITEDGCVLGGNMRLRAYRVLDIEDIWVSVVSPKNEKEKLEYALSDNDTAGFYQRDKLIQLIENTNVPIEDYQVHLGHTISVGGLLQKFAPNADDSTPIPDDYSDQHIQKIVLSFTHEQFLSTLERLGKISATKGLQNNTEAVCELLNFYEHRN